MNGKEKYKLTIKDQNRGIYVSIINDKEYEIGVYENEKLLYSVRSYDNTKLFIPEDITDMNEFLKLLEPYSNLITNLLSNSAHVEKLNKYEFTGNVKLIEDNDGDEHELYEIRALRNFGKIKRGEVGGFIQNSSNLSQTGNCWVDKNSVVWGNVSIGNDTQVVSSEIICDYDKEESIINLNYIKDSKIHGGHVILSSGSCVDVYIHANNIRIISSHVNNIIINDDDVTIESFDNVEDCVVKYPSKLFQIPSDCKSIKSDDDFKIVYNRHGDICGIVYMSICNEKKFIGLTSDGNVF